MSRILAVDDLRDPNTWTDLAALVGPGQEVSITADLAELPEGWSVVRSIEGVQLIATDKLRAEPFDEAVQLGGADADDMLALVARTQPGPFSAETYRLGTYLGVRRDGDLIAMAGERMHPPGWTEISAVCTDSQFRGQGLAGRLVRAVADGIYRRGDVPFLHTGAGNTTAISLYLGLGFELRKHVHFNIVRTPSS
ncbi:GNAT family N-acetyltransferase [Rhodococcus sp. 27YEA15]|uniref:GNAT family N-acetyltransferase n=1 Tax=Rhodococcus sp. 27YEA15 TaxID=3156259 RepID=UPI003C7D231B